MLEQTNPSEASSDAKFFDWQETLSGKRFPLFNITVAEHPLFGATVTEKGLRKLNLQVPRSPLPQRRGKKSR